MVPLFRSNLRKLAEPRYLSLNCSIGAKPFLSLNGMGKYALCTSHSLSSVQTAWWSLTVLGVLKIVFVFMSRMEMMPTRPALLSDTAIHSPSYFPFVSEICGWCRSPQVSVGRPFPKEPLRRISIDSISPCAHPCQE